MKFYLPTLLFFIQISLSAQQFTEQTAIALTGVSSSSVAWGDYDNDGDLDILLTGYAGGHIVSKIYRNNGNNTFTEQTAIALTSVSGSSVAWGDYDNDGDLDILLTGNAGSTIVSKIYRNNGNNTFTEQTAIVLTGVSSSSIAWGDYDNDGDLDILLTGYAGGHIVSKIYRNNGNNTFTEQIAIALTGAFTGSVAWGDYDNDGDLDILLTGSNVSKIYRNNGNNTFTEQTAIALTGVSFSSVAWGDYDNDGDLDILLTGFTSSVDVSKIYRNNGNNTFTEQTAIALTSVSGSSVAWGDYDNDGDLDILLTGTNVSKIYRNNGNNTFTEQTAIALTGVLYGSVAWGDYDNDGDLDILLTGSIGSSNVSKIYRNNNSGKNTLPTTPTNLSSIANGPDVMLSWNKSTDNETPQNGLKYNLVIGTTPNGTNTLSPMSDRNTGYRRVISLGNTNHKNGWTIKGLANGTYYWSVQAIDNSFDGSSFSLEQSFSKDPQTITLASPNGGENWEVGTTQNITWNDNISENVKIELYKGGLLNSIITSSTPSNGIYNWSIPSNQISGTDYKIKITSVSYASITDVSDNNFTLTSPTITVSSPNGGENWEVGTTQNITWNDNISENVKIELSKGGLLNSIITSSTPSNGIYNWSIQSNQTAGTDYKIKITSISNPNLTDSSDNNFSIKVADVRFIRIEFYENVSSNPSNTMNLINIGSKIRFKVNIANYLPQNILTAYGVINSYNPNILITDSTCTFNNVLSNQTEWSVDEFEIEPNSNIPLGSVVGFTLKVQQVLNPTGPWYSSFSFPIMPLIVGTSFMDDDNNPDSQGNGNSIVEPNETIEVVPIINNISSSTFYKVSGTLNSPYSFVNVWNNVLGVSGLVYDTYRYNLISGIQQHIIPGSQNIQPEVDYVFTYNASNVYQLPFNLIINGYYGDEPGLHWYEGGIKMKWASSFSLNQGYPLVPVEDSDNPLPTEYRLSQNYPNPFNPSTKISWQSPVGSWQTLRVYDILGNEVVTLVDEYKPSGTYEIEFSTETVETLHAKSLPSGVYFYQLKAGDFVETKKMILLR